MNIRKKFSSQLIMVNLLLSFIFFTLLSGFVNQLLKIKEYKTEIASLNTQIEETKLETQKLKDMQNSELNDNLESIARNRLNMVKPNEIIYIDTNKEGN